MTPNEALDIENCTQRLLDIAKNNDGTLLLVTTNPTIGVLPDHHAKIAMHGHSTEVAELLTLACTKKPDLKKVIVKASQQMVAKEPEIAAQ